MPDGQQHDDHCWFVYTGRHWKVWRRDEGFWTMVGEDGTGLHLDMRTFRFVEYAERASANLIAAYGTDAAPRPLNEKEPQPKPGLEV